MYRYVFDEQTTNQIADKTKNTKDILEQFSDVDKKYTVSNQIDTSLNLEKIDYVPPTKEQVETQAKESLQDYKTSEIDNINAKYNNKANELKNNIEAEKNNAQNKKQEIVQAYENVKQNAKDDAIKRGLARSSIIVNKLAQYDNSMLNNLQELSANSEQKISNLTQEKDALEQEKNNALNTFDIQYAAKLQSKIDSINSDITKAKESAIKYNNQIAELEAKWQRDNEQTTYKNALDMATFLSKEGTYGLELARRNEKYEIARQYFKSLDKQDAINELTGNVAYKENLGQANYDKLLREIKG